VPFLPCKIILGKFSCHLTADFFNTLGYKRLFREPMKMSDMA
jgi:hypothetical protein